MPPEPSFIRRLGLLVLPPLVVFLAFVLAWHYGVVYFDLKPFQVPSPGAVLQAAIKNRVQLGQAVLLSAQASLLGLACSILYGVMVAFFFSQSVLIQRAFYPYAIFLQTVPIVAIAPLIVYWSGPEFRSIVLTSFIISLFPIITNTTAGLVQIQPSMEELFRVNRATRWQKLFKLQLPSSIPYIVAGAKISSGLSVIGTIVGEYFAAYGRDKFGLGYLIQMTSAQLKIDYTFAAVVCTTLLGLAIFSTVSTIGGLLTRRWRVV